MSIKKRSQPQSRPKQPVKRNRRNFLSAEAIGEEEEEGEQDQLSMDAAIGASKIMELEEQLKEARLHLEQQMNLVGTQTEEISQLQHQLSNEKRVRSVMGSNAIRKDEAIEAARNLTTKTIEGLEISVEKLTKELAETKDRLVNAQTIDLQAQTQENTQKEQLQAELSQEKQTIVLLQAEMEGLRVRLEEIQRIPPPAPVYIPVQPQVDKAQIRQWEHETQENQKTIDLLK
jgi:DNA repair exonuclease SbcCD ATPase subunit